MRRGCVEKFDVGGVDLSSRPTIGSASWDHLLLPLPSDLDDRMIRCDAMGQADMMGTYLGGGFFSHL